MTMISVATANNQMQPLVLDSIAASLGKQPTLEQSAQILTDKIHKTFPGSSLLTRVFATIPFKDLPPTNSKWVQDLANSKGVGASITPTTQVLSLIGTSGTQGDWNNRRRSKGHVGIPLVSASFIDQIPMLARLLSNLGHDLGWIDAKDSAQFMHAASKLSGVFYVPDAATATDRQGRKIIADQAFVTRHGVKTVIGVGHGSALPTGALVVLLIFSKETLPEGAGEAFRPILARFRTETTGLTVGGKVFSPV